MSLIEWKDEYNTGIASVDHEHRELIELINALHDSMRSDPTRDKTVEALGEIYAQISAHFALEERIMQERHYRAFDEHKLDHETLLDELLDIMDSIDEDGHFSTSELSLDLDRWFSDHFRTHDAKLHKLLG
ncbi:MAG: bacteriohemerythrin [Gammaproteobacteria bacterium]|nr:bacteriohemerythrin [Gammaproteobacteria bacterium]